METTQNARLPIPEKSARAEVNSERFAPDFHSWIKCDKETKDDGLVVAL